MSFCHSHEEVLVVEHRDNSLLVEHADSDEELNELDKEPLFLLVHPPGLVPLTVRWCHQAPPGPAGHPAIARVATSRLLITDQIAGLGLLKRIQS